jgi:hypothetical protein
VNENCQKTANRCKAALTGLLVRSRDITAEAPLVGSGDINGIGQ